MRAGHEAVAGGRPRKDAGAVDKRRAGLGGLYLRNVARAGLMKSRSPAEQ